MPNEIFNLMRCGDNCGCCNGRGNSGFGARDMLADVLRTHGGFGLDSGLLNNVLGEFDGIDQAGTLTEEFRSRDENTVRRVQPSRSNRAVDILNTILANNVDPDPTPINTANFNQPQGLNQNLPARFSSGPQTFEQLSTFGARPIEGDGSGFQLRDQIRQLLRQLG